MDECFTDEAQSRAAILCSTAMVTYDERTYLQLCGSGRSPVPVGLDKGANADVNGHICANVEGNRHSHGHRHKHCIALRQQIADDVHQNCRTSKGSHHHAAVLGKLAEALQSMAERFHFLFITTFSSQPRLLALLLLVGPLTTGGTSHSRSKVVAVAANLSQLLPA